MRVYHHPYRRAYRLASSAGQTIRLSLLFVTCFSAKAWGCKGLGPLRSPTPCPHAVPRRPFVPHGPGTLVSLATPWGQGLRPCTPSGRRAGAPASRTPRRAGRQACPRWGRSLSCLQPSHRALAIRESAGGGVLVRPTSDAPYFVPPSLYGSSKGTSVRARLVQLAYEPPARRTMRPRRPDEPAHLPGRLFDVIVFTLLIVFALAYFFF